MQNLISSTVESVDPASAQRAIAEIDLELHSRLNSVESARLLLHKAVFLGILKRFDDAKAELARALRAAPESSDIRLQHDYIAAILCHDERNFEVALSQMDQLLKHHSELLSETKF